MTYKPNSNKIFGGDKTESKRIAASDQVCLIKGLTGYEHRRQLHYMRGMNVFRNRVMCELKESLDGRRVWVLNPRHATGGQNDDTGLRGVVPDAVRAD